MSRGQLRRMSVPFLILLNDGDTLAFIDPAPEDRSKFTSTPTTPHRIHSANLLGTESPYFAKLFTDRVQKRVRRQRGFAESLPDGVKYVIDLTPPALDEDAIIHITEVTCPKPICMWAQQQHKWHLPDSCVGGEDECARDVAPKASTAPTVPFVVNDTEQPDIEIRKAPSLDEPRNPGDPCAHSPEDRPRIPTEYSAKRHRQGIDHILHALHGLDVTLDTPCKLWTFYALAKLFDVATLPTISGWILSWFCESTNLHFVEIHPDIAYRVACGIKSENLCQDSFALMVGDEALLHLIRSSSRISPASEWKYQLSHSLIKDSLDDTEIQRVEYASKSFVDRVINCFLFLSGKEMPWLSNISDNAVLEQYKNEHPEVSELLTSFMDVLKVFTRYLICTALTEAKDPRRYSYAEPGSVPATSSDSEKYYFPHSLLQRIFGRSFWVELWSLEPKYAVSLQSHKYSSVRDIGAGLPAFEEQGTARIIYISDQVMRDCVFLLNKAIEAKEHATDDAMLRIDKLTKALKALAIGRPVDSDVESYLRADFLPDLEVATDTDDQNHSQSCPEDPFYADAFDANLDDQEMLPPEEYGREQVNTSQGSVNNQRPREKDAQQKLFNFGSFLSAVSKFAVNYSYGLLDPYCTTLQYSTPRILTGLGEEELRYLPLWAGGNDDGSGGVFSDHIMPVVDAEGFSSPGPKVLTGDETPSDQLTDMSIDEISRSEAQSTVQKASHVATFSHNSDVESLGSFRSEFGGLELPESALKDHDTQNYEVLANDLSCAMKSDSDGASTIMQESVQLSGFSDDEIRFSDDEMEVDSSLAEEDQSSSDTEDFEVVSSHGA